MEARYSDSEIAMRIPSAPRTFALPVGLACVLSATILLGAGCGSSAPTTISDANKLFLDAQKLAAAGDTDKAVEVYGQSIAARPSAFAYRARAQLLEKLGRDDEALQDCEAAIALSPDEPDPTALWLKGELQKPKAKRFQGQFQDPPKRGG